MLIVNLDNVSHHDIVKFARVTIRATVLVREAYNSF